ncbi:MAG: DUF4388 domain-containing protein, partial [Myxococcales bacterium]|nr:DUF4388 domain-containing protein [Myxococcales bacterium]
MALKGTIQDFGVADILQLIGQQGKTGVLVFKSGARAVRVFFQDGSVVGASGPDLDARQHLGRLMVRAKVMSQAQLDKAIKEQERTYQSFVDLLVGLGMVTEDEVRAFARLQTTETVYALFDWSSGTYEFESEREDPPLAGVDPIRAETVVMNGIRMTDEWPSIREKIPSFSWLVEPMRALPERGHSSDEFDLSSLTDGNMGFDRRTNVGDYERQVFALIGPGRTVQDIIDQSRLGEFETCSALSTLMSEGFVRVIKPKEKEVGHAKPKADLKEHSLRVIAVLGRIAVSAGIVLMTVLLLSQVSPLVGARSLDGARYVPKPV